VTQERYNPATGKLEESAIEYDQYGRQIKRTDYTNHGYGDKKSQRSIIPTPTRTYDYGPGYGSMEKIRGSIMISLPELNELLVAHNCVHAISNQLNADGTAYDLFLSISDSETAGADVVSVRFIDISQFASRDFGGGLTQLMHMSVNKMDSGLDRVRYQLSDLEDNKLSFYFS